MRTTLLQTSTRPTASTKRILKTNTSHATKFQTREASTTQVTESGVNTTPKETSTRPTATTKRILKTSTSLAMRLQTRETSTAQVTDGEVKTTPRQATVPRTNAKCTLKTDRTTKFTTRKITSTNWTEKPTQKTGHPVCPSRTCTNHSRCHVRGGKVICLCRVKSVGKSCLLIG